MRLPSHNTQKPSLQFWGVETALQNSTAGFVFRKKNMNEKGLNWLKVRLTIYHQSTQVLVKVWGLLLAMWLLITFVLCKRTLSSMQWKVQRQPRAAGKEKEKQAEVLVFDQPDRPHLRQESVRREETEEQHQPGRHPKSEKVGAKRLESRLHPFLTQVIPWKWRWPIREHFPPINLWNQQEILSVHWNQSKGENRVSSLQLIIEVQEQKKALQVCGLHFSERRQPSSKIQ